MNVPDLYPRLEGRSAQITRTVMLAPGRYQNCPSELCAGNLQRKIVAVPQAHGSLPLLHVPCCWGCTDAEKDFSGKIIESV